jgi:hypothetical protein
MPRRVALPSTGSNALLFKAANVHTEAKLAEMGIKLPPPGVPKGNFAMAVRSGKMVYLCTLHCVLIAYKKISPFWCVSPF